MTSKKSHKETIQYAAFDPRFPIDSLAQVWQDSMENAKLDGQTMANLQKKDIKIGIRVRATSIEEMYVVCKPDKLGDK